MLIAFAIIGAWSFAALLVSLPLARAMAQGPVVSPPLLQPVLAGRPVAARARSAA